MNSKIISILIAVVFVLGVGFMVYVQNSDSAPSLGGSEPATTNETGGEGSPQAGSETQAQASGVTMAEVARHSTRTDCWTVINGAVYDMTSWIPNHPGGEAAIVQLCGVDGSAKFDRAHGGSSAQLSVLAGFKIDVLAQ